MQKISPRVDMPSSDEVLDIDLIASVLGQYITGYGHDFIGYVLAADTDQA